MPVKYCLFSFLLFFFLPGWTNAQSAGDSSVHIVAPADSTKKMIRPLIKYDTLVNTVNIREAIIRSADSGRANWPFSVRLVGIGYREMLKLHPYYNFFASPVQRLMDERKTDNKDGLFYLFAGLVFYFAIVRVLFYKYFNNLILLMFRASLKQKQIREQLIQTPLPSLLLNIFFVIVGGLYVLFLLRYYHIAGDMNFWLLLLYCSLAIGLIYTGKFLMLKFTGWVFNMRNATDTYSFIVFLVNKILGIFLLPLVIVMAFAVPSWQEALVTISYILVFFFFAYRYIVSFAPVRKEVKVSQFHFFMYLCAFEITPLLLIYKVLMRFL